MTKGADKAWPFGVRIVLWTLCQAGLLLIAAGFVLGLGWVPETLWALSLTMFGEAIALAIGFAYVWGTDKEVFG